MEEVAVAAGVVEGVEEGGLGPGSRPGPEGAAHPDNPEPPSRGGDRGNGPEAGPAPIGREFGQYRKVDLASPRPA